MLETMNQGLDSTSFMPHGFCFLWTPSLLWTYVFSDSIIAASYFSIPFALWYFARNRQDLPFRWIFILFGFFVLACGTTHLFAIVNIWQADYWADAGVKVFTAIVSAISAIAIWRIMPFALAMPTRSQLELVNNQLNAEIKRREGVEAELFKLNMQLEELVGERTSDLQEKEYLLQSFVNNSSALIYMLDLDGKFILVNDSLANLFGHTKNNILGKRREEFMPQAIAEEHQLNDLKIISDKSPLVFEEKNIESDGDHYYLTTKFPLLKPDGAVFAVAGISTDITQRKRGEVAMANLNRTLRALSSGNHTLIHAVDEMDLLRGFCKVIVESGGYRMAWVGYLNHDEEKLIRPVAHSGVDEGYLEWARIT